MAVDFGHADVYSTAMGRDTVHFRCHHCLHCCTEVVCLPTPWDVARIVRETGEAPARFLEFLEPGEITGVAKSDPTWLECGEKRYLMALKRGKRGCYFLNKRTRLCSIYESRPILCRLYPFRLQETRSGEFKGFTLHTHGVECPRHRDGAVAAAPLYALYVDDQEHQEAYDDLVEVFNEKQYSGKKPEDFVHLFIDNGQPAPWSARK